MLSGELALDARPGDLAVEFVGSRVHLRRIDRLESLDSYDVTVSVARVSSMDTHPELVVDDPAQLLVARALVGAYLLGIAEAATATSAKYAATREQFGKPIGSFQAVKHRCAEMAIRAYAARTQLLMGAALLDAGQRAELEVTSAYLLARRAAMRNADDDVMNHGAVGMTAENVSGLLVKRAQLYSRLVGNERSLAPVLLESAPSGFEVVSAE
jgi:hypothetical protein